MNSFVSGLPFGTQTTLTPTGDGVFNYTQWEGMAYYSNFGNMLGSLWLLDYGALQLTDPAYQYGNTIWERATSGRFWLDFADRALFGRDDPNIVKSEMPELVTWVGPGGAAKAGQTMYTVYRGIRNGRTVYWGITNNLTRRIAEHGSRFRVQAVHRNVPGRNAAKGLEQMMMDKFGLQNLDNVINSIAKNNPKLMMRYREAVRYLQSISKKP